MKSGNLNFLEPSGPLQACNGTALPLLYEVGLLAFFDVITGTFHITVVRLTFYDPFWYMFVVPVS